MATTADLLTDAFGRIHDLGHRVVDGLSPDQLTQRLDENANSIAWLVWHLTRIQDDHVAEVAGHEQVWTAGGFAKEFALGLPDEDTGYGHAPAQVAAVRVPAEQLIAYLDATHQKTLDYVAGLSDADLDRIVDDRWDPPVTLAVRLVSVLGDDWQHAGQAALLRGLLD